MNGWSLQLQKTKLNSLLGDNRDATCWMMSQFSHSCRVCPGYTTPYKTPSPLFQLSSCLLLMSTSHCHHLNLWNQTIFQRAKLNIQGLAHTGLDDSHRNLLYLAWYDFLLFYQKKKRKKEKLTQGEKAELTFLTALPHNPFVFHDLLIEQQIFHISCTGLSITIHHLFTQINLSLDAGCSCYVTTGTSSWQTVKTRFDLFSDITFSPPGCYSISYLCALLGHREGTYESK